MATTILSVQFRGTRRIRLFFTGALASGAFTTPSMYGVVNDDGLGFAPISVVALFAVATSPEAVELAVDSDLAGGARYTTSGTAVPCADLSSFTGSVDGRPGLPLTSPANSEPAASDFDLLLYGRDIAFNGADFVEDASGDLANLSGRDCWSSDIKRRLTSQGLNWDPSYGPRAAEYVDAPQTYAQPLAGSLVAQARQDDRTKQATVSVSQDPSKPGDWRFLVTVVGKDNLDPLTVAVRPPGAS